jgi:hypothetical protein
MTIKVQGLVVWAYSYTLVGSDQRSRLVCFLKVDLWREGCVEAQFVLSSVMEYCMKAASVHFCFLNFRIWQFVQQILPLAKTTRWSSICVEATG